MELFLALYALWALIGIILFYVLLRRMERWTGKQIWSEGKTYFMFIPAAACGPVILFHIWEDQKIYRKFHGEDKP